MQGKPVELKAIARRLLEEKRVEVVIGYAAGPEPHTAVPAFARTVEECEVLIFDRTCEYNLARYLHKFKGKKVAIVAKGCDERSIVGLIQEKQVVRENLVILGAPCAGVADPKRAGESGPDALYAACRICPVHNPRFADYLIAEPVEQPRVPAFSEDMEQLSAAPIEKRWEAFQKEMSKCILCFACRSLCPASYCPTCFTESSQPKWMSKTADQADAMFFHLTRLTHLAGRCTGCGACERGCPMKVNLHLYNDRLRKDVKEVFGGFEAGMDPKVQAPMASYQMNDKNDFIM
jgi:formate dehydrogenase (coenzyme F420) beta subunit